jgi:hypothetical protein
VPAPQPPAPPPKSEATIEDVPMENRRLADSIVGLLRSLEAREDLSPTAKKALQDAKAKLSHVFAAFRDNTADADLVQNLTVFIQKLLGSDGPGASTIRKQLVTSHIQKCRDVILWMNYVQNAMK